MWRQENAVAEPSQCVCQFDAKDADYHVLVVNGRIGGVEFCFCEQSMLCVWSEESRRRCEPEINQLRVLAVEVPRAGFVLLKTNLDKDNVRICVYARSSLLEMKVLALSAGRVSCVAGKPERHPDIIHKVDPFRSDAVVLQEWFPCAFGNVLQNLPLLLAGRQVVVDDGVTIVSGSRECHSSVEGWLK